MPLILNDAIIFQCNCRDPLKYDGGFQRTVTTWESITCDDIFPKSPILPKGLNRMARDDGSSRSTSVGLLDKFVALSNRDRSARRGSNHYKLCTLKMRFVAQPIAEQVLL